MSSSNKASSEIIASIFLLLLLLVLSDRSNVNCFFISSYCCRFLFLFDVSYASSIFEINFEKSPGAINLRIVFKVDIYLYFRF